MAVRTAGDLTGATLFSLVLLLLFGLSISAAQVLSASPLSSNVPGASLGPLPTCSVPSWSIVPSQNPSSYTNYLQDVSALSESAAWSVGYYNTSSGSAAVSLVERWDGSQWSTVPVPHVGSSSNRLAAVEAIAPDNVWAVGHYRYVTQPDPYDLTLILHWDGAQWTVVPSPNVGVWNNLLYDISAVSPDDIWAVGSYRSSLSAPEQMLTMHWDGSDWTIIPSPNPGSSYNILRGVTAVSTDDVWAVGYYDAGSNPDQTMILHWNGSQWEIVPSANAPTGFSLLYSVDASASGDVWAVGYNSNPPGGQVRTLVQHWDGTSWTLVNSPNPGSNYNSLTGVSVVSANDVWAVGNSNSGSGSQTMTLHWDGHAWSQSPSPNAAGGNWLNGVDAVSGRHVWAVGYSGSAGAYRTLTLLYGGNDPCGTPNPSPSATATVINTGTPIVTAMPTLTLTPTPTPITPSPTRTVVSITPTTSVTPSVTPASTGTSTTTSTRTSTLTTTPTQTPGEATPIPCTLSFSDVPTSDTFYVSIRCLACRGIISGYSDGTFRPNNQVTRGQLAKIVSNSAGFSEPPTQQTFEDVLPSNTFYEWIERLTTRGYMTGYLCGGTGEPCTTGRPYFRPFANATRGQTAKIVSNAAMFTEPPVGQTFEDVPSTHTFYEFIQRLASRNVMGGYLCGGQGEPCTTGKPYFRPQNDVTRGQSAKIVANAFFPGCVAFSHP